MNILSIETNWNSTELAVNFIPVELKAGLESYLLQRIKEVEFEIPETDKIDITLEHIWYGFDDGIITIEEYWNKGFQLIEYIGPSFSDRDEILHVLSNNHASKNLKIHVDGIEINPVSFLINCNFHKLIKPLPEKDELSIYHGGILDYETIFEIDIAEPFEENKLVLNFTDCSKHGYILTSAMYDGTNMDMSYDTSKKKYFDLKFFNRNHELIPKRRF